MDENLSWFLESPVIDETGIDNTVPLVSAVDKLKD